MRANGIEERYITGKDTTDWEKFEKWAQTVPAIYEKCNEYLQQKDFSARGLIEKYGVETLCTTDDPVDSLEHHRKIAADGFPVKVLPAWRPDQAMAVEDPPV